MKLLLTSAGITNEAIAKSLENLTGAARSVTKIALIPTAANAEAGNKDWFFRQHADLTRHGFTDVDIIDFSAPGTDWKERLEDMDVIYVSGGNTFHLLNQMRITGFDIWIKENIDKKVYVGVSAGTIVVTPTINVANVDPPDANLCGISDLTGLHLVNFEISPHTPNYVSYENIAKYTKTTSNTLYALDDNSAIELADGNMSIVSEGIWKKYD